MLLQVKVERKPEAALGKPAWAAMTCRATIRKQPGRRFALIDILSLRPASSERGEPKLNEPAPEHKSVRVKVPAKAGDQKTTLVFEMVYEGKAKK